MRRVSVAPALVLAAVGLMACTTSASPPPAGPPTCTGSTRFDVSPPAARGGQASPVEAARWFAGHGGVRGIAAGSWRQVSRGSGVASVASGTTILQVMQGTDGTWFVDSGRRCT